MLFGGVFFKTQVCVCAQLFGVALGCAVHPSICTINQVAEALSHAHPPTLNPQHFNEVGNRACSSLLFLAVIGIIYPTAAKQVGCLGVCKQLAESVTHLQPRTSTET